MDRGRVWSPSGGREGADVQTRSARPEWANPARRNLSHQLTGVRVAALGEWRRRAAGRERMVARFRHGSGDGGPPGPDAGPVDLTVQPLLYRRRHGTTLCDRCGLPRPTPRSAKCCPAGLGRSPAPGVRAWRVGKSRASQRDQEPGGLRGRSESYAGVHRLGRLPCRCGDLRVQRRRTSSVLETLTTALILTAWSAHESSSSLHSIPTKSQRSGRGYRLRCPTANDTLSKKDPLERKERTDPPLTR